jgi:hypothetical protein
MVPLRRTTVGCMLALGFALVSSACDDKKPSGSPVAATSVAAKASATASAAPVKKPSFEELVAKSTPLAPEPKVVEVGKTKLSATLCRVEDEAFLDKSSMKVLKAIEVVGDKAYVVDADGVIHGFTIEAGDGCVLKADKGFGDAGKLKLAKSIEALSRDDKGNLVASTNVFGTYFMKGGKVVYDCKPTGVARLSPTGGWAISSYANSNVAKISYGKDACKEEPWVLQDLSKPETRKGPFSNVNTVGFLGKLVLVGGVLADKVENRQPKVVVAYDETGKEKFRFGNTDKTAREDNFGWIHGIVPCKPGICVLDSNYRRITVWKKNGSFIGNAKLSVLFGVRYPWVPGLTSVNNTLYFVAGQDRGPKSGVSEGLIYRVAVD